MQRPPHTPSPMHTHPNPRPRARSDLNQPLPRWRRRAVEASSQGWNRVMLFAAGFWAPRVRGLQHWEEGKALGAIGVFNHVSYVDAFVVTWALCAAGLTFEFTGRIPVLGRAIRALQARARGGGRRGGGVCGGACLPRLPRPLGRRSPAHAPSDRPPPFPQNIYVPAKNDGVSMVDLLRKRCVRVCAHARAARARLQRGRPHCPPLTPAPARAGPRRPACRPS